MFQASYLNYVEVKCFEHPRTNISHLCTDYKCFEKPFLCSQCLSSHSTKQKHYGHDLQVRQLIPAVDTISQSLSKNRKPIQQIYKKLASEKQYQSLLNYHQEKQHHCQSIRKHIQSIKFEIDEEMQNLLDSFKKQVYKEKDNMYKELEKYYENYKQNFQQFCNKIGPISSISKSYKYYASKHNILLKMMTDSEPSSLSKWFIKLKGLVKASEVLASDHQNEYEKVKKLSSSINEAMDQLPRIRNAAYYERLPKIMNNFAHEIFREMVKFGAPKLLHSHSLQGQQIRTFV